MDGHIKIDSLYIDPGLAAPLDQNRGILCIQHSLRELILHFDFETSLEIMDRGRETRLISVLDELAADPLEPIDLPMPNVRRLWRLTEAMVANPVLRFTIGARVGASNRTHSQLFQRETGLPFFVR